MIFIAYTFKGQVHVFAGVKIMSLILQDKCNIRIFLSPETSVLNFRASTVKCEQLADKLSMNSLCMILVNVHLIALTMARTLHRVPTSSGNHGKPQKSHKKSSMHGKIMEFY